MHDPWSNLVECLSGTTEALPATAPVGSVHRLLDERSTVPQPEPERAAPPQAFIGTVLDLRLFVDFGVVRRGPAANRTH